MLAPQILLADFFEKCHLRTEFSEEISGLDILIRRSRKSSQANFENAMILSFERNESILLRKQKHRRRSKSANHRMSSPGSPFTRFYHGHN